MAIDNNHSESARPFPALACTVPYLAGMVLIFVGERLVGTPASLRLLLDGIGLAGILWAIGARILNRSRTDGDMRSVEGMILTGYLTGLLSLVLYGAQVDQVRALIWPLEDSLLPLDRYRVVLQVLWPIIWLSSVLPVLFMETSYASMAPALRVEKRRIFHSAGGALSIAWVISSLFLINYLADAHNRGWDLSFLKASSPSPAAQELVSNLDQPLEVFLLYPKANEVCEELLGYFEKLEQHSDKVQVHVFDHALEPRLARELGVKNNGTVVFRYGDKKETEHISVEKNQAVPQLSVIDQSFQKKFLKLVAQQKVAYFVSGHGERHFSSGTGRDQGASVKGLKSILRAQNFEVKTLGLAQGLADKVPDDASLLLVIDPTEDFLPAEIESIEAYLDSGGKIWMALEPGHSSNIADIAEYYGVRFVGSRLANDRFFLRDRYNRADRFNLFTNLSSSHPSVNTVSRNPQRLAVIFPGTGYLEKVEEKDVDSRVVMTLRSMPGTRLYEGSGLGEEADKTYELAAAVSVSVGVVDEEADKEVDEEGEAAPGKGEMRMLVLADADAIADKALGSLGNFHLFDDGLKWLFQDDAVLGSVGAEKDVRIVHTKEEDVVWFYTTIFAVPLILLATGVIYNRYWVRRKKRGKVG